MPPRLRNNELIAAIELPVPRPSERSTILELARRSGDYAMAGVAAQAQLDVQPLPSRASSSSASVRRRCWPSVAMAAIDGKPATPDTIAAAQAALDADLDPPADLHGTRR